MGICPSVMKRYDGVGGLGQRYVTPFFLANSAYCLAAIQVLHNVGGGVSFPGKKRYEGVRFNAISITRGWVEVKFPGKKRYVTLEWPLGLPSCPRVRHGFHDNLASISNNMFLCIMLTTKQVQTLIIIRNSYNAAT